MALRWTAAGMLGAEWQFRKIIGYRGLVTLVVAIDNERERTIASSTSTKEAAIVVNA